MIDISLDDTVTQHSPLSVLATELEEKSLALSSDLGAGYQAPHVFTVPLSARNPLRVKVSVSHH